MGDLFMKGSAVFSECGAYRYRLDRRWGDGPTCGFIMLNPSTADAEVEDPTLRRCIGFAKREHCGAVIVLNCYAYRSTDPAALKTAENRVGGSRQEIEFYRAVAEVDGPLVAAWGAWTDGGASPGHWIAQRYADRLMCLGRTKDGSPRHPLYVRSDAPLVRLQQ